MGSIGHRKRVRARAKEEQGRAQAARACGCAGGWWHGDGRRPQKWNPGGVPYLLVAAVWPGEHGSDSSGGARRATAPAMRWRPGKRAHARARRGHGECSRWVGVARGGLRRQGNGGRRREGSGGCSGAPWRRRGRERWGKGRERTRT